jgi:hypothetical protein
MNNKVFNILIIFVLLMSAVSAGIGAYYISKYETKSGKKNLKWFLIATTAVSGLGAALLMLRTYQGDITGGVPVLRPVVREVTFPNAAAANEAARQAKQSIAEAAANSARRQVLNRGGLLHGAWA